VKNAHARVGKLPYRRQTEKTATNLRVFLGAFLGALVGEGRGKAHLVSVVRGDAEIGAQAAAFANGDSFTVENPYGAESIASLGREAAVLSRFDYGPWTKATSQASCELLAGIGGRDLCSSSSGPRWCVITVCQSRPFWGSSIIEQLLQQKLV
jgi:hypothetical protein